MGLVGGQLLHLLQTKLYLYYNAQHWILSLK